VTDDAREQLKTMGRRVAREAATDGLAQAVLEVDDWLTLTVELDHLVVKSRTEGQLHPGRTVQGQQTAKVYAALAKFVHALAAEREQETGQS
jgi:hypothetical protein